MLNAPLFLVNFHSLARSIKKEIADITRQILEQACLAGVQLEEDVSKLILDLAADKMVSPRCKKLYLYCKELEFPPESVMRIAAQDNKITDDQCHERLLAIESLFAENKNTTRTAFRADCLQAADMLRQLLYHHLHEIKTLPKGKQHLLKIDKLKTRMESELFNPVLKSYLIPKNRLKESKSAWKKMSEEMSYHRCTLVQLIPYKFVITKMRRHDDLVRSACFAWYNVISELADKSESFMEEDVACLLALKRLAPFIPNQFLQIVLTESLNKLFRMAASPDGVGGIPDEKIAILSQWVNDLGFIGIASEQLKTSNELWKKSHGHVAHGRNTASAESVPSASTQGFGNFQAIQRPVVLKKKEMGSKRYSL